MQKQNSPFAHVKEQEVRGEVFTVTHRILQIPRSIYTEVLKDHQEPFSEDGAQAFVEAYLQWQGDTEGVVGMVRFDETAEEIVLDAAIRYRIDPQERPSCLDSCKIFAKKTEGTVSHVK
ncbi:MAG: hypothetical protein GX197_09420 [Firmicutes bacterium]|nr:hypothetical protein [Bacillota bacterium]